MIVVGGAAEVNLLPLDASLAFHEDGLDAGEEIVVQDRASCSWAPMLRSSSALLTR